MLSNLNIDARFSQSCSPEYEKRVESRRSGKTTPYEFFSSLELELPNAKTMTYLPQFTLDKNNFRFLVSKLCCDRCGASVSIGVIFP